MALFEIKKKYPDWMHCFWSAQKKLGYYPFVDSEFHFYYYGWSKLRVDLNAVIFDNTIIYILDENCIDSRLIIDESSVSVAFLVSDNRVIIKRFSKDFSSVEDVIIESSELLFNPMCQHFDRLARTKSCMEETIDTMGVLTDAGYSIACLDGDFCLVSDSETVKMFKSDCNPEFLFHNGLRVITVVGVDVKRRSFPYLW